MRKPPKKQKRNIYIKTMKIPKQKENMEHEKPNQQKLT